jgi:hypothetical protein
MQQHTLSNIILCLTSELSTTHCGNYYSNIIMIGIKMLGHCKIKNLNKYINFTFILMHHGVSLYI